MSGRYPELLERRKIVKEIITAEEERFLSTIEQGLGKLHDVFDKTRKKNERTIAGRDAFVLYDTYGFPMELTKELADEEGLAVDEDGFRGAMEEQKERARVKSFHVLGGPGEEGEFVEISPVDKTEFLGYDELACDADPCYVRCFAEDGSLVADLVTDRTVFYAESGGQVGDKGTAVLGGRSFEVVDTFKRGNHYRAPDRVGRFRSRRDERGCRGVLRGGGRVRLEVDREERLATARNHTATHLLHAALRNVLGKHVAQAGSLVEPDRLRFDFHHHQSMSGDDVRRVEDQVNDAVLADLPVTKKIVEYKEAVAAGAMALFGEKYSDKVRVVTVEGVSQELCGGTHLARTGEIGAFIVKQEAAVGAGVRRIEALTGKGALAHLKRAIDERGEIARTLKVSPDEVERRVRVLLEENERLKKKLVDQESRLAGGKVDEIVEAGEQIRGVSLVTLSLGDGDVAALRRWGDRLREKLDLGVALVCLTAEAKPMLLIVVSDRAISEKKLKANELADRIAKSFSLRGGGKPHMAQMGLARADDFERVKSFVREVLENLG